MNKKGTALVTGGAIRVGKSIALALAQDGYSIALHCNSSLDEAQKTAAKIRKIGVECEIFQCDFNDSDKVEKLIARVYAKFPDLNILVNNASIFEKQNFMSTSIDTFDRHMNINLKAPMLLIQDFSSISKKGNIINILDTNISSNKSAYFAYLLSKKSLCELTKMTAKSLAPDLRVNGICIGSLLISEHWTQEDIDSHTAKLPLGKPPKMQDITNTLLYLIKSNFLTGQTIYVDSGQSISL